MAETQSIGSSSNMEKVDGLPDEIIEDILLRLPAQPLLRFKSVSKSWCELISNSRFIREHRTRGAKLKIMFRMQIRVPNEFGKSGTEFKYPSVDYDAFGEDVEMPGRGFDNMELVYNSCHGLVVVMTWPLDGSAYIWNPTTGQRHLLPNPLTKITTSDVDHGLGYDPIARVYKVLCDSDEIWNNRVNWSLYEQCTNSWKELKNIPYRRVCSGKKFLENALHILACPLTSYGPAEFILAFDMSNEKFREVPLPNYGDPDSCEIDMVASHSRLCLVSVLQGHDVVVWVMKEYGNHESWTKMFSINKEIFTGVPSPIHLSENGELLVFDDSEFPWDKLLYTPKALSNLILLRA